MITREGAQRPSVLHLLEAADCESSEGITEVNSMSGLVPDLYGSNRASVARLAIFDQHWHCDSADQLRLVYIHLQTAFYLGSLHFIPVVLEPDLHLSRSQAQAVGEVFALGSGQVTLLPKPSLKFERLCFGEEDPPFLLLLVLRDGGRAFPLDTTL